MAGCQESPLGAEPGVCRSPPTSAGKVRARCHSWETVPLQHGWALGGESSQGLQVLGRLSRDSRSDSWGLAETPSAPDCSHFIEGETETWGRSFP